MQKSNRSQQYKSFIILADIPIFVIVGAFVGYYLLGGENSESAGFGALIGSILFFILALIPAISLALKEHNTDKQFYSTKQEEMKNKQETVKNTLFSNKNE
jgi:hypothetical protein